MKYYLNKSVALSHEAAVEKVKAELAKQGFGVLSEIDVRATLKKKLDVDFRKYVILGACNPPFAHRALQAEEHLGLLLPCNVVVYEQQDGRCEVAAIDPLISMRNTGNPELEPVAGEVRAMLARVIEAL